MQIIHIGPEHTPTVGNNELQGVPVTETMFVGRVIEGTSTPVRIGAWPSGLYAARLAICPTAASASRRSSSARAGSVSTASQSSCRR